MIKVKEMSAPLEPPTLGAPIESATESLGSSLGSSLGGLNPTQIMGLVNKLGGIDGILNTVTKINKMIATMQQLSGILKMFGGSFFNKTDNASKPLPSTPPSKRRRPPTRNPRKRRRRK